MGVGLAISAIASGIGAGTTFSLAAGLSLGFSFTAAAVSIGLGVAQSLLTPSPRDNLQGSTIRNTGITQNVRQAITTRRSIYGEVRVGGAITFLETTNDDQFLHMIITLCDHEVEEIGEIWFDDTPIPPDYLDDDGNVIDGTYDGHARIKTYLGTIDQQADSDLVSETSATSNYRGRGVAYIYVRLDFDRDIFPGSIPTITAFVKGKKILDTRDDVVKYTANTSLFVNDFLTSDLDAFTPGIGVDQSSINLDAMNAAANICEEMVTTTDIDDAIESADPSTDIITLTGVNSRLQYQTGDRVTLIGSNLPTGLVTATNYFVIAYQRREVVRIKLASSLDNALAGIAVDITSDGSGTIRKNAEPRYFGGGITESSETPQQVIEDLLSASGGTLTYIGGDWHIRAAAYNTPVFTFDESHIISRMVVKPKVARRDRFNLVKGTYISPINDGQASDYPSVGNSTYQAADSRVLPIDLDLPFTQRVHTAQRLAKIRLEKHRQEIFFEAEFKLHAMQVQPGDTVYINNARMGWVNKVFEVMTWTLGTREINGVPLYYVNIAFQETASAVFDWNNGEETRVDPAPNTNLPNPLIVAPPTGLGVTPAEVPTAGGDLTYEFVVSWTPPNDIFVVNGGHFNVEFKRSSETEWRRSFRAEDTDTSITVRQVQPGLNYDVRVQSVNNLGVRSAYQQLLGFTVDSPSGATIRIDYGQITGNVNDTIEFGQITGNVDAMNDYEDIN